jgi:hypothetical protein
MSTQSVEGVYVVVSAIGGGDIVFPGQPPREPDSVLPGREDPGAH